MGRTEPYHMPADLNLRACRNAQEGDGKKQVYESAAGSAGGLQTPRREKDGWQER